ncbi:MAG: IS21 family transposase, partial [Nitrospirota bacterium]
MREAGVNVLTSHLRITIETLLSRGVGQREIERRLGVDRKTIRRYARMAQSPGVATGSDQDDGQTPPPRPPAVPPLLPRKDVSACEPHRAWIEAQVALGRNAVSLFQDLVERHGFAHQYNSVKRFVATLKARAPERFDVLEFLPGEEAQVDYGQGAPTRIKSGGKYQRPYLFVMTLKYSGKSFRTVVWKTNQEVWAQLHERAFRAFGGCCQYVVLDNLKEGVLRPDLYEPGLNPVYAALLAHYGVVADPCRVRDPNRKGTVESAIQHTQGTALKGRRFESLDEQHEWLAHWEERWAARRIHGRKKRQVLEMYQEEQPHLRPLPLEGFRLFTQGVRTVDDAGLVQVEGSYYA